jgi:hypothetical protein
MSEKPGSTAEGMQQRIVEGESTHLWWTPGYLARSLFGWLGRRVKRDPHGQRSGDETHG